MNDEKLSLRLESELLARIDSYLEDHPEAGSRSHFIKNCIRAGLDRDAQISGEPVKAGPDSITITLPGRYMAGLERMVAEDYCLDLRDAAETVIKESMRQLLQDAVATAIDGGQRAVPGSR